MESRLAKVEQDIKNLWGRIDDLEEVYDRKIGAIEQRAEDAVGSLSNRIEEIARRQSC